MINQGRVYINGKEAKLISDISWNEHSKFNGVFIKKLLNSDESDNNLTSMIVKINPGSEIKLHTHIDEAELHEIIEGNGNAMINSQEVRYFPGIISFIPANIKHSIKAGKHGLLLYAKFTPPLNN